MAPIVFKISFNNISKSIFAPHWDVIVPLSNGGDTSTRSAPMKSTPSSARIKRCASIIVMPPDSGVWTAVIYTAVFASAYGFIVQTWSQSFMSATTVGVIFTTEYIFAAIFGVIFGHEHLTQRVFVGGVLVMVALYIITWDEGRTPHEYSEPHERMAS